MVTVIDYGMGNLRSVVKAIEQFSPDVRIARDPSCFADSHAVVMPGDGAFGMAMQNLKAGGWIEPLKEYIARDGYFLGICLGYQLLFSSSEEFGDYEGLNIIQGRVVKFRTPGLKVPHMGWNNVRLVRSSKFTAGVADMSHFYFIHTYYPELADNSWALGMAEYGAEFACMVNKGNLIATQFHPEKSHSVGLKIVENFVRESCL